MVIFYGKEPEGRLLELQKAIGMEAWNGGLAVLRTIEELHRKLLQPLRKSRLRVTVLAAASRQDLEELMAIRELLSDCRTILILPDRDRETISMAHKFRPRFLTDIGGDLMDVIAVLKKMFKNGRNRGNGIHDF